MSHTSVTTNDPDHLLSPILSNFFPTIFSSQLAHNHRFASGLQWNTMVSSLSSLTTPFLLFTRFSTIDLSCFANCPPSSLTPSVDLLRLDILCLTRFEYLDQHGEDGFFETLKSEMMPKLLEFHTSGSSLLTKCYMLKGKMTRFQLHGS